MLTNVSRIHCIGVGGIGVGALAELLFLQGYQVTGSDALENVMTKRLAALGLNIWCGSDVNRLCDVDLVIYSSAIPQTDSEFKFAIKQGIPCVRRGEVLAHLFNLKHGIAVAGSHGKTTTSSIVAHIVERAGWDPTYCIGGIMNHVDSPVRLGQSEYFIAEADESDKTFLSMRPRLAIVTNIDRDHLNNYEDDYQKLQDAFVDFLNALPPEGSAILNYDDAGVRAIMPRLRCRTVCFSLTQSVDFLVSNVKSCAMSSSFRITDRQGVECSLQLQLPGKHNVLNAMAAYAATSVLGVPLPKIQHALAAFSGVGKRFYCHGSVAVSSGDVVFLEDYGHHPYAIQSVIAAVRQAWPGRRLVMIFQPHRFSRTQDLWQDFVTVLSSVDCVFLTRIYAASEASINGVSARLLSENIAALGRASVVYVKDQGDLSGQLLSLIAAGDIILFQGAGTIAKQIPAIMESVVQGMK